MAAELFLTPAPALDSNGNPLSGAKWYFYATGTTTPQNVYSDSTLLTSLGAVVTADSAGRFAEIYFDPALTYRGILKTSDGATTLYDIDPINNGALSALSATTGAGLVGYDDANTYSADTVGRELQKIGTYNHGALGAGTTVSVNPDKSFSGHSGGTTDFRGWVDKVTASGGNAIAQVNARNVQLEITATGTVTSSFGTQAYIRAGLGGVGAVNVTSMRVNDAHVANEGTGAVATATCYFADGVDLIDGTGAIQTMMGFYCGNQGHATRVTTAAIGYNCADFTAGAPLIAAFRSQMTSGTNKYAIYSDGNAQSVHAGNMAIGSGTAPTDMLEVRNGYLKATSSTDFLASGSYHELRSANADFAAKITNKHASTPEGLHIKFTASTPNNTTQRFLFCDDQTATRLIIYSNGNVQNANNSYGAISDRKLKTAIKDAGSQVDDIKAVRLRKYQLKSDGKGAKVQLGVIAQELEETSPGLVSTDGDGTKSVNYSILYLKAVGALQEALAMIDDLTARVSALEGRQ
jgi:Chaperone of endosialidase